MEIIIFNSERGKATSIKSNTWNESSYLINQAENDLYLYLTAKFDSLGRTSKSTAEYKDYLDEQKVIEKHLNNSTFSPSK